MSRHDLHIDNTSDSHGALVSTFSSYSSLDSREMSSQQLHHTQPSFSNSTPSSRVPSSSHPNRYSNPSRRTSSRKSSSSKSKGKAKATVIPDHDRPSTSQRRHRLARNFPFGNRSGHLRRPKYAAAFRRRETRHEVEEDMDCSEGDPGSDSGSEEESLHGNAHHGGSLGYEGVRTRRTVSGGSGFHHHNHFSPFREEEVRYLKEVSTSSCFE